MRSCCQSSVWNDPNAGQNPMSIGGDCSMIEALQSYHPLIVEGMGGYDRRDPKEVSQHIVETLQKHWRELPPQKPVLLITQGDPYEERGISAITRQVCDGLAISRALIFLDPDIAAYHAPDADRYKVIFEIPYSTMTKSLETTRRGVVEEIFEMVGAKLDEKNAARKAQGKKALPPYYPDFAMLQEVTKIACKQICGGVTIAHTSREINPFSVTSFYHVGLQLGLVDAADMIAFPY
jgi:hypothetical protein